MAVPGAPTSPAIALGTGLARVSWNPPASDGGKTIVGYVIEWGTSPTLATFTTELADWDPQHHTLVGLTPGATVYAAVRAQNADGIGPRSSIVNVAVPTRSTLDIVKGASVDLADGTQVVLRSDGANSSPALTIVAYPFGAAAAPVTVANVVAGFYTPGGPRNLSLVALPNGDLFVVGIQAANPKDSIRFAHYARTGPTTWSYQGVKIATVPNGDFKKYPFTMVAAAYVPGSGANPKPSIFAIARRPGELRSDHVSWALIDANVAVGGAGTLLISSGSSPTWLPAQDTFATANTASVDVTPLTAGSQHLAILAGTYAAIKIQNGVITSVVKGGARDNHPGLWSRVVGVDADKFAIIWPESGDLKWAAFDLTGAQLLTGAYAAATASGGAFDQNWDAARDHVSGKGRIYYVANDSARHLAAVGFYYSAFETFLTTALGPASSTNSEIRVPHNPGDERRTVVEAANILSGTKSTAVYHDLSGNLPPNAPALTDEIGGFDAGTARVFAWAFSDDNPLDTQTAYEFVIERVSDGVAVVSSGKVTSTAQTRTVNSGSLVNGTAYRWRVRTYDALDVVGAWAAYDTFTPTSTGTLTITVPAADNPAGIDVANVPITWSYTSPGGYVQTQRRVRVIRVSDSAVLFDSTMQATAVQTYAAPVPASVQVRIEVSIVTNGPGTPTVGPATRLLTSAYDVPMTPTVVLSVGECAVAVDVTNPAPTGNRPNVVYNVIERRPADSTAAFEAIGTVEPNGVYDDYTVASGKEYDYRVRGVAP